MTTLIMSEEHLTVQSQIDREIRKFNIADNAIQELTEKYSVLFIADKKDKTGYEIVRRARAEIRGYRIGIEAKRKELKSDYIIIGRRIDDEAKRLTELLQPLENNLSGKLDTIDQQIEAEKRAIEDARLKKKNERIAQLTNRRMLYSDGKYMLNHISIDAQAVEFAEDDVFALVLESVETEYQKEVQKEKQAAEIKRQEEERIKAEQEAAKIRIQKEREELAKMQAELKAGQEKLRKEEQARTDALIADQNKLEAERKMLRDQRITHRTDRAKYIGLVWDGGSYAYGNASISPSEITTMNEEDFIAKITHTQKRIAEIKVEEAKAEKERIERLQKEAAEKALKDKADAEQRIKEQEAEKQAMASDKVKFQELYNQLCLIAIPEMKSVRSKKILAEVVEIIINAQKHINNNILKR